MSCKLVEIWMPNPFCPFTNTWAPSSGSRSGAGSLHCNGDGGGCAGLDGEAVALVAGRLVAVRTVFRFVAVGGGNSGSGDALSDRRGDGVFRRLRAIATRDGRAPVKLAASAAFNSPYRPSSRQRATLGSLAIPVVCHSTAVAIFLRARVIPDLQLLGSLRAGLASVQQ